MRRRLMSLLAIVLGCTLLSACDAATGTQVRGGEVIRVGANLELSGWLAELGQESLRGIELGVQDVNAAGGIHGRDLELVVQDNGSDTGRTVTLATKLATQDKVVAVIGPGFDDLFRLAAEVAQHQQVPVISPSATGADALRTKDGNLNETAFRVAFADPAQGAAMARFALEHLGAQQALVLRDGSSQWAVDVADQFAATFSADTGTITADDSFAAGESEFGDLAQRVAGNQFDVVLVAGAATESGHLVRQLREAGVSQPILGTTAMQQAAYGELAGAGNTDIYHPSQFSLLDTDNPQVATFAERFRQANEYDPDVVAALGYDSVQLLADAIKRADAVSGAAIGSALGSTRRVNGVTGSFTVGANHEPNKEPLIIQLNDGQPSVAGRA